MKSGACCTRMSRDHAHKAAPFSTTNYPCFGPAMQELSSDFQSFTFLFLSIFFLHFCRHYFVLHGSIFYKLFTQNLVKLSRNICCTCFVRNRTYCSWLDYVRKNITEVMDQFFWSLCVSFRQCFYSATFR